VFRDLRLLHPRWRPPGPLPGFLARRNTVAIADIDTRKLTRILREKGAQAGCIASGDAALRADLAIEAARRFPGLKGMDLAKDGARPTAAYEEAQGVRGAFNLNLLTRINRELGGDFDLAAFRHQAVWNAEQGRMEMHLVSQRDQFVTAAGRSFRFAAGESIHTENSYKFTLEGFARLAAEAGWKLERTWVSSAPSFAVVLLRA